MKEIIIFMLAVLLSVYSPQGNNSRFVMAQIVLLLAIAIIILLILKKITNRKVFSLLLKNCIIIIIAICFGFISHLKIDTSINRFNSHKKVKELRIIKLEGTICSDPKLTAKKLLSCNVDLKKAIGFDNMEISIEGRICLYIRAGNKNDYSLTKGQYICFDASKGLSEPFNKNDILSLYSVFLDIKDIHIIKKANVIEQIRNYIRKSICVSIEKCAGDSSPLLIALLLGIKDDLDSALSDSFRDAGCSHILALSGQHVAILASLISLLIIRFTGPFKTSYIISVFCMIFLYIAGASPSVFRAVVMYIVAVVLKAIDRPQKTIIVICITFCISLIFQAESIHCLSFKLSYLAVGGITLFSNIYIFFLKRWLPSFISSALGTGLAAICGTTIISVSAFGVLCPFSPITSSIVSVLITAIMYLGIVFAVLVSIFPSISIVSKMIIKILYTSIEKIMAYASSFPPINVEGQVFSVFVSVALLCLLLYALPHARYFFATRQHGYSITSKLRFTYRAFCDARKKRPRDEKEIWTKFLNQQSGS